MTEPDSLAQLQARLRYFREYRRSLQAERVKRPRRALLTREERSRVLRNCRPVPHLRWHDRMTARKGDGVHDRVHFRVRRETELRAEIRVDCYPRRRLISAVITPWAWRA